MIVRNKKMFLDFSLKEISLAFQFNANENMHRFDHNKQANPYKPSILPFLQHHANITMNNTPTSPIYIRSFKEHLQNILFSLSMLFGNELDKDVTIEKMATVATIIHEKTPIYFD